MCAYMCGVYNTKYALDHCRSPSNAQVPVRVSASGPNFANPAAGRSARFRHNVVVVAVAAV